MSSIPKKMKSINFVHYIIYHMKQILLYLVIAIALISCGAKEKEISETEFSQLYTHDSILSVNINDDFVRFQMKTSDPKGEFRRVKVASADEFYASLTALDDSMRVNNIPIGCRGVCRVSSGISGIGRGFHFIGLIEILIFLAFFVFTIVATINLLRSKFSSSTDKLIWLLVIVFFPFIGAVLYWSIGRKQRIVDQK